MGGGRELGERGGGVGRGGGQDSPFRIATLVGARGERERERGAEGCSETAWEM